MYEFIWERVVNMSYYETEVLLESMDYAYDFGDLLFSIMYGHSDDLVVGSGHHEAMNELLRVSLDRATVQEWDYFKAV